MFHQLFLYLILSFAVFSALAAPVPTTPIEHVIVIVGENRTFDNLYATYRPKKGQAVWNLLSRGIVLENGLPGKNFNLATQHLAQNKGEYTPTPDITGAYSALPQPYATGAIGQRRDVPDARFPTNLPNGPFQITRYVGYGAHTGDPIHRFFQMWQQVDGGKNDLFVWTAETVGVGPSNGKSPVAAGKTYQGGVAMGFYNMAAGDAPYFRELADRYALADNYHQSVMGGTTANYLALTTADVAFYTRDGKAAAPPAKQIENPDAQPNTNNWYSEDGYAGGSYVNCSNPDNPGAKGINKLLQQLPYKAFRGGNCDPDTYYMVNNMDPAFTPLGEPLALADDKFLLPPQIMPSLGDALSAGGVSWKWYSGGRNDGKNVDKEYCAMCDTQLFFASTMQGSDKSKLHDLQQFYQDAENGLPAVSIIAPYDSVSGHPGYAMETGFDELLRGIVNKVQQNPELWKKTAIFVTFDEGGGYYDSGYIQFIDFFGDGTRVPLLVISPYAKKGYVDHTYYDHASILKFIERNWGLPPLSARSRDNLPNPLHNAASPYVPLNRPAIGDLMNLFQEKK
ncbi:MAG: alkaline phosphatase family protein [Nitrosomonadales bacterium]|nr:alkaline phosphatase family protein [Nitrosomonadales bacterium]